MLSASTRRELLLSFACLPRRAGQAPEMNQRKAVRRKLTVTNGSHRTAALSTKLRTGCFWVALLLSGGAGRSGVFIIMRCFWGCGSINNLLL